MGIANDITQQECCVCKKKLRGKNNDPVKNNNKPVEKNNDPVENKNHPVKIKIIR